MRALRSARASSKTVAPHVVAQEFSLHRVHLREQFADVAALKCVLLRFHDELGEFRE